MFWCSQKRPSLSFRLFQLPRERRAEFIWLHQIWFWALTTSCWSVIIVNLLQGAGGHPCRLHPLGSTWKSTLAMFDWLSLIVYFIQDYFKIASCQSILRIDFRHALIKMSSCWLRTFLTFQVSQPCKKHDAWFTHTPFAVRMLCGNSTHHCAFT